MSYYKGRRATSAWRHAYPFDAYATDLLHKILNDGSRLPEGEVIVLVVNNDRDTAVRVELHCIHLLACLSTEESNDASSRTFRKDSGLGPCIGSSGNSVL